MLTFINNIYRILCFNKALARGSIRFHFGDICIKAIFIKNYDLIVSKNSIFV